VGSAAGWVAVTTVFVFTLASGHALPLGRDAQIVAGGVLALIDAGAGLLQLSFRKSLRSDKPSLAARRRARQAGRTAARRASRWRPLQFLLVPSLTASLSRPVGVLLAAGLWTTVAAWAWQTVAATQDFFGASETSAADQRIVAALWMGHLMVWCSLACRRIGRCRRTAEGWL